MKVIRMNSKNKYSCVCTLVVMVRAEATISELCDVGAIPFCKNSTPECSGKDTERKFSKCCSDVNRIHCMGAL